MSISFKSSPLEFNQHLLFPSNIFDLLAKDHECYLYTDLFQQLDTSAVESSYKVKGQNAYHPRLIVSILIYAYSRGVFSSRQIERRCREDVSFMYIAQMNCPNFRVLSDFRKVHGVFFQDCFKQTVKLALALKLVSLGHISLDGSKFKANSSKHKAMSYGRLKEKEQALSTEIDALIEQAKRCDQEEDKAYKERTGYEIPEDLKHKQTRLAQIKAAKKALEQREEQLNPGKDIEDKKQISFADTESRIMGKKGNFNYAYNAQISVDADLQIIVGQHISQNANDKQEVELALEALLDTADRLPDRLSVDNGYWSGDNLQALEASSTDAYIATDKGEKAHKTPLDGSDRKLVKADFKYHEADNTFTCPGGQVLKMIRESQDGKRVYQGSSEVCADCPLQSRCCQSDKGNARTINTDNKEPLRQQMNSKMATESAKAIYSKRKTIVEPVFGQIKNSGFRGFSVRGKEKVAGEFSLVCATHNFKKIAKAIFRGVVRPEFGHLATNPAIYSFSGK
ncbi:IS1182 family transposase [Methylobacter svalbardensis]|uniref:IS1182 family transposase n=1 Tax=Methylobacter svalbardensis TaxID=3080016 RepID=UPI0030EDD908